jgi:dTDP-4-dehydrorhamnose reductase
MMEQRIVITGHLGQLGRALKQVLSDNPLLLLDLPEHDITDSSIIPLITHYAPDLVMHSAAYTDVDGAEREPDAAYRVNCVGTHNIALASQRSGAAMLLVSTNEVFDGNLDRPYREWDAPNPISTYARTKAAAEDIVRSLLQRFYIVRVAWMFAPGGSNFVSKILTAADLHGSLRVVDDEVANPSYAPDVAKAMARLIETEQFGTFHMTNSGSCSRFEFAREILRLSGREHVPITPIPSSEWPRPSTPPLRAILHNSAAASLGITLRPWQEALADYFALEADVD